MARAVENDMKNIFYNVQFNKTNHSLYTKKLMKLYQRTNLDTFSKCFISCLKVPLTMAQEHPRIINTLEFCAKFSMSLYSCAESESIEPMNPFLNKLFTFLLSSDNAKDKAVRYRICHFLNMLLNSMGDHAFIDDSLCDEITIRMMDRLMDKSPKVRAQAVFALHRLQEPSNDQCPIIKMYLFHLYKDPKPEVRRAVLATMSKNQKTLLAALKKTRDIDDSVRKMAYEFISKITIRSLTIEQRERLLKDGLKDRSDSVKVCVSKVLLPTWLRYYNGEYIKLIHGLDAGIGTEVAVLALQALFKNTDVKTLLEQVPINKNIKLIPLSSLSCENTLYWKCVINHLHNLSCTEELDLVIPELSAFCNYICEFIAFISSKQYEEWEKQHHKFILLQLFEITEKYDLSDEVGRKNLQKIIIDALMSDHCCNKIIDCIVHQLDKVVPNISNMLDLVANVISETRLPLKESTSTQQAPEEKQESNIMQKAQMKVDLMELEEELYETVKKEDFLKADSIKEKIKTLKEKINQLSKTPENIITDDIRDEKNDAATMTKCLNILCATMQVQSIRTLTPTLRSMMSIVLDSLDHPDDNVHVLALKALGMYCILDKEMAKKHLMIFFYQFSAEQENPDIWIIALKGIFDLLLFYGLEYFEILQIPEERSGRSRMLYTHDVDSVVSLNERPAIEDNSCNFVHILTGLLDNANQELRTIAAEGLCKLLLNRRISSSSLVSRLIILCYNPANADDIYLRQCLCAFFDHFAIRVPDAPEMLESAYFPTLRVICNAPDISPLQNIDTYHVSRFILTSIRRSSQKFGKQVFDTHNNLAFAILAEILNPDSAIDQETLIKSLMVLCVQFEDGPSKGNLQEAIEKVTNMVKESDKRLLKYIQEFKRRLETSPKATEINGNDENENGN
ncbi:condensin complex subunit 3-like [Harpegnathos saltator]|uniref:condensin complex subunit 3-like n=1 Tax=Harpegnathos saltator TaxID=610380 RepID=UPI000DBEE40A|nr:condensin complex subunit 3-like [Harpegnathos saltator]